MAKNKKHLRCKDKVGVVMSEFERGTLHSGKSGKKVTNPKQAIAIGLSEMRKCKKKNRKKR